MVFNDIPHITSRVCELPRECSGDAEAVNFGPARKRFCASLDSPEALGDPGENAGRPNGS